MVMTTEMVVRTMMAAMVIRMLLLQMVNVFTDTLHATDEELLQIVGTVLEVFLQHLLLLLLQMAPAAVVIVTICFVRVLLGDYVLLVDRYLHRDDTGRSLLKVLVGRNAPYHLLTVRQMLLTVRAYQLSVLADGGRAVLALLALPAVLPLGRVYQIR